MADIPTMAEYIYRRASQLGVDPNMALGIASREGLNERTINSPTFGNVDTRGYSFGPFQLFSASRDPRRIAPGGMAYEFQQRFGAAPSADNWKQQVDFSLERMQRGTSPWYAVRNAGGVEPITAIGREAATRFGLGLPPNEPAEGVVAPTPPAPAPAANPAMNPMAAGYQGAEANPGNTFTPPPVYASDIGTGLRRLGNFIAPDLVDPATPLTPEQIREERERSVAQAERMKTMASAQGNFGRVAAAGMAQPLEALNLQPQVVNSRQFQPLQPFAPLRRRQRGLLD